MVITSEIELLENIAQEVQTIRFVSVCVGCVLFGALIAGIVLTVWFLISETKY